MLAQPGQEERHQLLQVLDVMAERGALTVAGKKRRLRQVGVRVLAVSVTATCRGVSRWTARACSRALDSECSLLGGGLIDVPDDQRARAVEQFVARRHQPLRAGHLRHVETSARPAGLRRWCTALDQGHLADPRLAFQGQPFAES